MVRTAKIAALIASLFFVPAFVPTAALADVDMTLEELPEPVRQTALREVKDGSITDIERETEKGVEVFEVEYVAKDGQKFELDIGADGTLLRRHRD